MRHLSEQQCAEIAKRMATFRGLITWEDVVSLGREVTGQCYSRVTLSQKEDIRTAYDLVNERAAKREVQRHSKKRKSKELLAVEARIEKLTAENERLEAVNSQLREQFVVWAENARKKGLSEADLNRELPKLHRKSSQGG